jgi:hypothetical protein
MIHASREDFVFDLTQLVGSKSGMACGIFMTPRCHADAAVDDRPMSHCDAPLMPGPFLSQDYQHMKRIAASAFAAT